jgi:hypothetical protein
MRRLIVVPFMVIVGCATEPGSVEQAPDETLEIAGCPEHNVDSTGCITAINWTPKLAIKSYFPAGATNATIFATTGHVDPNGTRYVYMWIIKDGTTVDTVYSIPRPSYASVHAAVINDFDSNPNAPTYGSFSQEGGGLSGTTKPGPHTPGGDPQPWFPNSFVKTVIGAANELNTQYSHILDGTRTQDYQQP